MTQAQALSWINGGWKTSKYAKTVNGVLGIDADGAYGFQCKDYIFAYLDDCFGAKLYGNAIDLWTNNLPSNIKRIPAGSTMVPEPGDVFVFGKPYGWDGLTYLGHTGCVIGKGTSTGFTSVDQNWNNANLTVGSPPATIQHNYTGFLGVLRPVYEGANMATLVDDGNIDLLYKGVLHRAPTQVDKDAQRGRDYLKAMQEMYQSDEYKLQDNFLKNPPTGDFEQLTFPVYKKKG